MTERSTARLKRSDDAKTSRKHGGENEAAQEIARLRAELDKARQYIAVLEQRHADVVNRIDWVLDSLHNLPSE